MLQPELDNAMNTARNIVKGLETVTQEDSNQSLARVVYRLTHEYNFDIDAARPAAAKAIAEHDSRKIDGAFDLKASTKDCIFYTVNGETRVASLAEVAAHLEFL